MRELMRIPVFNRCSATGWGQTNESRKILTEGLTPETAKFLETAAATYHNGDLHHPHPSFTDGTYDGRYLFVNDKANTRVARIRLDVMKCDKIIQLPEPARRCTACGVQKYPAHRLRLLQRRGRVADPQRRQGPRRPAEVLVDLHRRRRRHHEGRLADHGRRQPRQQSTPTTRASTPSRPATTPKRASTSAEMMANEQDWVVIFNLKRIEEAVKTGDYKEMNGVPVLDGRHGSHYTRYVPVPNSPHGINTAPDGIHVVANGKLSPTVTVFDVRKLDDLFDDKIKPRDVRRRRAGAGARPAAHRL